MEVNGRPIRFLFSVGAYQDLEQLCPGGDIRRVAELFRQPQARSLAAMDRLVLILARWQDAARALEGAQPQALTAGELAALPVETRCRLAMEAVETMLADAAVTVEVAPGKSGRGAGIELTPAWYLFYGRLLHMTKQEVLSTRYGEMVDMISCFSIYNGAKPRKKKTLTDLNEVLKLR